MGTFVFTTGSVWSISMGICFLSFLLYCYVRRGEFRFRSATFILLMLLPLTHHVVAAVAFLLIGFLTVWSVFFAITHRSLGSRHRDDVIMTAIPIATALVYYKAVSLDRLEVFASPIKVALMGASFVLFCLITIWILSLRSHSRLTFSPFVGGGFALLLLMDYFGFFFPYRSSAGISYLALIFASGVIVGCAWYGAEIVLETRRAYSAIQLGMLLAPLTIMVFGISEGLSTYSHQIVYRGFDLVDPFLFTGIAAAFVALKRRHGRLYPWISLIVVVSLLISFPFSYDTGPLLGVRHDTQQYEMDAISWIRDRGSENRLITDERLSYVASAYFWYIKDASLPIYLLSNDSIMPGFLCLSEDSWTTSGVNSYPRGLVVDPSSTYQRVLHFSDVLYLGGPANDHVVVFLGSANGQEASRAA